MYPTMSERRRCPTRKKAAPHSSVMIEMVTSVEPRTLCTSHSV